MNLLIEVTVVLSKGRCFKMVCRHVADGVSISQQVAIYQNDTHFGKWCWPFRSFQNSFYYNQQHYKGFYLISFKMIQKIWKSRTIICSTAHGMSITLKWEIKLFPVIKGNLTKVSSYLNFLWDSNIAFSFYLFCSSFLQVRLSSTIVNTICCFSSLTKFCELFVLKNVV